jgi:flagellar L-ring protein precursor FlgH
VKSSQLVPIGAAAPALIALLLTVAAEAAGPSSSLFGNPNKRRPLTLAEHSWTSGAYQIPQEVKQVKLHDLITVIVDEKSVVISEGEMDRKKKAHGDLILKDWVLLKGLAAMFPDPQSLGDPHVRGEVDNKMRAEAGLETRDSMKFYIACQVVDIRPNGNLVVEGHDRIRNNNEVWDYSLLGEIRPEDVLPDNTVLSKQVFNKKIDKRESGHVRDGYRRGWLLRWLDKWQPF